MRSFRLDPHSVTEFRESWPGLVVGLTVLGLLAYLGLAGYVTLVAAVMAGGFFVLSMRNGSIGRRLRQANPGARSTWMLTVGLVVFSVGFVVRVVGRRFRDQPGLGPVDLTWLGGSFLLILVFVILNRENASVTG